MGKSVISPDYMEKILQIRPDSLLFARYAYHLLMMKKGAQAQKVAIAGVDKSPNFATGRFVLALCLYDQQDYDLALMQYYEVLKIEPTYLSALAKISEFLALQERNDELYLIEDFIFKFNSKSHFLGKNPRRRRTNEDKSIFEVVNGSELNWREFASESYLRDNQETDSPLEETENGEAVIENTQPAEKSATKKMSLEEELENEFAEEKSKPETKEIPVAKASAPKEKPIELIEEINEKADEILAKIDAEMNTLNLEDTAKHLEDIFAQIEAEGFTDEQGEGAPELNIDFSNVSEKCNSETLAEKTEVPTEETPAEIPAEIIEEINEKADEILAKIDAEMNTLSLEDTAKQLDDIFAQIEAEGFTDEQGEGAPELNIDFSNVSEKCNSETLAEKAEEIIEEKTEPKELSIEEQIENELDEAMLADVADGFSDSSLDSFFVDFGDEKEENEGAQEQAVEIAEIEEVDAIPAEAEETAEIEELEIEPEEIIAREEEKEEEKPDELSEFFGFSDSIEEIAEEKTEEVNEFFGFNETAEIEEIEEEEPITEEETAVIKELEEDEIDILSDLSQELAEEIDEQLAETFDTSFENYRNEEKNEEKTDTPISNGQILENAQLKLNEDEEKAEPTSEKEAFADMLAKTGTDLLPNHILTPTFAQIYLEQGQPFLARQIYERLLARDGENDDFEEKLAEINEIIEKMKKGENVVIEPKKNAPRPRLRPAKVLGEKKSLKGKRIKKEVREALKEKLSSNSKESS